MRRALIHRKYLQNLVVVHDCSYTYDEQNEQTRKSLKVDVSRKIFYTMSTGRTLCKLILLSFLV